MGAKQPTHCPGTHCEQCDDSGFVRGWWPFRRLKVCPNCRGDNLRPSFAGGDDDVMEAVVLRALQTGKVVIANRRPDGTVEVEEIPPSKQ